MVSLLDRRLSEPHLVRFDRKVQLLCLLGAAIFCVLVGLKIHYSSIELWNSILPSDVAGKSDRSLIAGVPKAIRSDEWVVSTTRVLQTYVRAGSASLSRHALDLLSPWNWGFYALGIERGFSFLWNFWFFGSIYGIFFLMMLLSANRFGISLFTAVFVFFSSYNRWWDVTTEVATASLLLVCAVYFTQSHRRLLIWLSFLGLCVFALKFVLLLYPPWQVVLAYLLLALAIAFLFREGFRQNLVARWRLKLSLATTGFVAAVVGGVVAYRANAATIQAMLGTVYPGKRVSGGDDVGLLRFFSGYLDPFFSEKHYFYRNICESSGFILLFPFVAAALLLEKVAARSRKIRPVMAALMAYIVVLSVYTAFGFGAPLSRLTLLSFVPGNRAVLGIGLASVLLTSLYIASPAEGHVPMWVKASFAALALAVLLAFALEFSPHYGFHVGVFASIAVCGLLALAIAAMMFRAKGLFFAVMLALVIWPSIGTNPIAAGLAPIYGKRLVQAARLIVARHPGKLWIVYGDSLVPDILKAAGADVFNGATFPPRVEAMRQLDPTGVHRLVWNRYARIHCTLARGGKICFTLNSFDSYTLSVAPDDPRLVAAGVQLFVLPVTDRGSFPAARFHFLTPRPLNGYLIAERTALQPTSAGTDNGGRKPASS